VQWDVFTTPTFKGNVPRVNIAYGMAYRWLQAQGVLLPVSKTKTLDERTASSFIHFRFVEYETLVRLPRFDGQKIGSTMNDQDP